MKTRNPNSCPKTANPRWVAGDGIFSFGVQDQQEVSCRRRKFPLCSTGSAGDELQETKISALQHMIYRRRVAGCEMYRCGAQDQQEVSCRRRIFPLCKTGSAGDELQATKFSALRHKIDWGWEGGKRGSRDGGKNGDPTTEKKRGSNFGNRV